MKLSEGHVSDSQANGKSQLDSLLRQFSAFARTHTFDASWLIKPGGVKRLSIEMAPREEPTNTETVRLVENENE